MTSTHIIDGKAYAQKIKKRIADDIKKHENSFTPCLATILVGSDPASIIYVKNKIKTSKELGIRSLHFDFPESFSQDELLREIAKLNQDPDIDGILVQMPLPQQIDSQKIIESVAPEKDVDGFHPLNSIALYLNKPGLYPCTPSGSMMLMKEVLGSLSGLNCLVIGRSLIVGKPMGLMLLNQNATVTFAHSHTHNLKELCQQSDVVISAIGKKHFVRGDWIKSGAVVIDVGINREPEIHPKKIWGDVCFDEALGKASAISPVPGGVGPMTIACLMLNTLKASCLRRNIPWVD